jgi:hypothetical protein
MRQTSGPCIAPRARHHRLRPAPRPAPADGRQPVPDKTVVGGAVANAATCRWNHSSGRCWGMSPRLRFRPGEIPPSRSDSLARQISRVLTLGSSEDSVKSSVTRTGLRHDQAQVACRPKFRHQRSGSTNGSSSGSSFLRNATRCSRGAAACRYRVHARVLHGRQQAHGLPPRRRDNEGTGPSPVPIGPALPHGTTGRPIASLHRFCGRPLPWCLRAVRPPVQRRRDCRLPKRLRPVASVE